MFPSLRHLHKFIKSKNYIFEDRSSVRKDFAQWFLFVSGSLIAAGALIVEFGVPPPDVMYDLRCLFQPDFYQYVNTKGKLEHSIGLLSNIRSFRVQQGHIEEMKQNEEYRQTFIEHD